MSKTYVRHTAIKTEVERNISEPPLPSLSDVLFFSFFFLKNICLQVTAPSFKGLNVFATEH